MTRENIYPHVYRDHLGDGWAAQVTYLPEDGVSRGTSWLMYAPTWAEAMQAVDAMRHLLDRLLMDQVHASRATRRTTPKEETK